MCIDAGYHDGVASCVADVLQIARAGSGAFGIVNLLKMKMILGEAEGGFLDQLVAGYIFEIVFGEHRGVGGRGQEWGVDVVQSEKAAVLGGGVGKIVEALAMEFGDEGGVGELTEEDANGEEVGAGEFFIVGGEGFVDVVFGTGVHGGPWRVGEGGKPGAQIGEEGFAGHADRGFVSVGEDGDKAGGEKVIGLFAQALVAFHRPRHEGRLCGTMQIVDP